MAKTVTIDGIPVFDAVLSSEQDGMDKISLVDEPAVMSNFISMKNTERKCLFAVENEEKRLVYGVIMRADFPIYRIDPAIGEFYLIYKADTIRQMAEKYLADGKCNNVNVMHSMDVEGVQMVQYFLKDTARGVDPSGFDDIADGSLFGEFHVLNDEVWNAVKEGTFRGFSLEGWFDITPETDSDSVEAIVDALAGAFSKLNKITNMTKMEKIKAAITKILVEFGSMTTDKGVIYWKGDEALAIGDGLFSDEAGETALEDGEYTTDKGDVIVVAEGKVAEIKPVEAPAEEGNEGAPAPEAEATENAAEGEGGEGGEAAPAAEGGEGEGESEEGKDDEMGKRVEALENALAAAIADIDSLKAAVEELQKAPATVDAHEAYKAAAYEPSLKAGDRRSVACMKLK